MNLQELTQELKKIQDEIIIINNEYTKYKRLKNEYTERIKNIVKEIDKINNPLPIVDNELINRDIDIVYDFLSTNGPSYTKDINDYVNFTLENETTRWKKSTNNLNKHLDDTSNFQQRLGQYIDNDTRFTYVYCDKTKQKKKIYSIV